jgi:N-acetylmuramoyl-L-alanine amidase
MAGRRRQTVAIGLALVALAAVAARGDEPAAAVAVAARLAQDGAGARLQFDVSRPVDARVYGLSGPNRILVDLPEVNFRIDPAVGRVAPKDAALVSGFRFGLLAPGRSRIVVDLARPVCPAKAESKPIVEGEPAARLTIELKPCDAAAFAALPPPFDAATTAQDAVPSRQRPMIVLDPGHGGADGGARGIGGTLEKTLVLDFCKELKRQLDATGRYAIAMTREGDQYVDLDDRVTFARDANASLFISVHADTLREAADVSGSTVYTLADRASDAEAARIAATENAADRTPGREAKPQDDPGVADIMFDLKRRETRTYAHIFSRGLVDNLRGAARLNNNPERSAGFVVLKAPDFPSVLVELGYLSNPQDVQALSSPEWRTKAASAMIKAIDAFFSGPGKPGDDAAEPGVALGDGRPGAPSR